MKKIGIVGGVAWPSTVEYYTEICRRSERRHLSTDHHEIPSTPEMTIESLDLKKAISYIGSDGDEESWSRFDEYHRTALQRLATNGADFSVIASNSPHHRFAAIVRGIEIPVISLLKVTAEACARIEARQVLILGTALTMRSETFRKGFADYGVEAAGPRDAQARALTAELIAELQGGRHAGAAARIAAIATQSWKQQFTAPPVVCLACTELPLAFPDRKASAIFELDGITYINTSAVHIGAAFDYAAAE